MIQVSGVGPTRCGRRPFLSSRIHFLRGWPMSFQRMGMTDNEIGLLPIPRAFGILVAAQKRTMSPRLGPAVSVS